ncbi:hypothetical protein H0E86_31320 [Streptomyces sp. SCSIO-PteL053]|nr:hypothetical protein H0E86_31320 [Streptomyces sp. SCSIO-PteL053]
MFQKNAEGEGEGEGEDDTSEVYRELGRQFRQKAADLGSDDDLGGRDGGRATRRHWSTGSIWGATWRAWTPRSAPTSGRWKVQPRARTSAPS